MAKQAAYGIALEVGTAQVETATIVCPTGAITGSGNIDAILTKDLMVGDPITTVVAVLITDTSATVATKIITDLLLDADIIAVNDLSVSGVDITVRSVVAVANDGTYNLSIAASGAGGCTGLTDDLTSTNTTAGVALAEIVQVTNIGGPGISLDLEDVTTHDQATSWEEVVATILRSGEVTLDIVYDPSDGTHDATTGLVYRQEDKIFSDFNLVFPDAVNWAFDGYVTGFEPTGGIAGALTATVKVKIHGAPTLE